MISSGTCDDTVLHDLFFVGFLMFNVEVLINAWDPWGSCCYNFYEI